MHSFIIFFTLLTFSSVAVSALLQEVLNIAKCVADIHQELPNSCIFIMNLKGKEQGKDNFFLQQECSGLEKMYSDFASSNYARLLANTFFWK
jgi:hypothetical protein